MAQMVVNLRTGGISIVNLRTGGIIVNMVVNMVVNLVSMEMISCL
jgi:hypothetical protein